MQYDYFLFDWDGCLGETLEVWMEAYKATFRDHGLNPTDQDIAGIFGDWQGPAKLGITDNEIFVTMLAERASEGQRRVKLYPGAREILDQLKSDGKHLALLTSSLRAIIETSLEYNGIENYFEVILTGEDVTNHKPHPEVIETALKRMRGAKDQAVMIGDSDKDIRAATNAGVDSILIFPKEHEIFYDLSELKSHNPTYIFESFGEMSRELFRDR